MERQFSPEGYRPPEEISPISPEDQERALETLEEQRQEIRRNALANKKMERSPELDTDYADKNKKTTTTRHAGPIAKIKRGVNTAIERINNASGLRIKLLKEWDSNLQENNEEDSK